MVLWKSEHSKTLLNIFLKPVSELWRASAITGYQFTDGGLGFCEGGCVPNTAKLCSDAPANIDVWRMMDCVLGEMELASLPCGSSQDSAAGCAQTGMVIRDDKLDAPHAARDQAFEKLSPIHLGFRKRYGM